MLNLFLIPLIVTLITALLALCIFSLVRNRHGSDIRVVWYVFSLTLVITIGLACYAISNGAIDGNGEFHGDSGDALKILLLFMLDIKKDMILVVSAVTVLVLPQLLAYTLSGLSGCASTPVLVNGSLAFLVWGNIKALVVYAGISLSIGILCLTGHLSKSPEEAITPLFTSLATILLSFSMLLVYREGESFAKLLIETFPRAMTPFTKIHKLFTRNETKTDSKFNLNVSLGLDGTAEIELKASKKIFN
ncbi:TPA: hypothetical protein NOE89_000877 [Pseudomonas aeruginosa]|nr:hypothetical protein [Pseudomonas aeruginosa]